MTLTTILFYYSLVLYASCNGQSTSQVTHNIASSQYTPIAIGDTVSELGKHLMLIYQDKKNNYWFGSWGEGVYRYDGRTILHFTTKHGLPHNKIVQILEDKTGNIYFNTDEGISKFDGQHFTTLRVSGYSNKEWKLGNNDLWFKGRQDSALVYRYDGKYLHGLSFPPVKLGEDYISAHSRTDYPNMNSSPYDVYTIYKDTKGNVWFGTGSLGVCRFDGKSIDWISDEDVTELHDGPSNGVRSIIEDKDGYFWFSNSLYRYKVYEDKNEFKYTREKSIGSLDGKKDGDIVEHMSIARDNNNDLWIVMYSGGVWRYNGKNITHYRVLDGSDDINLFSIYKDNHGDLWLGTHEWGVYKFNGKTFERLHP